ncbi:MAG: bacterial Ig-like domain-containing protein, partial [Clostridia bacterium]|nr:bacterial Ig-like domain-containing protein [Clostridia bacterium]
MDVARKIRERDTDVIIVFVTNMIQYAVEGYSVQASDFIVKPAVPASVNRVMNRALVALCRNVDKPVTIKNFADGRTVVLKAIAGVTVDAGESVYAIGDEFKGASIAVEYVDGTSENIAVTSDMLTGFDTSTVGAKTVKIAYDDMELSFDIAVYARFTDNGGANKFQAEDENFVDMSGAQLQSGQPSKFENTTTDSKNESYSNGAEGKSTASISVTRSIADKAGKYKLGRRAQSCNNKGLNDVNVADAFDITVNGDKKEARGVIKKASSTDTAWKDMASWTTLDDIAGEIDVVAGLNEIEFAFKGGTAQTMRFPNLAYFILTAV